MPWPNDGALELGAWKKHNEHGTLGRGIHFFPRLVSLGLTVKLAVRCVPDKAVPLSLLPLPLPTDRGVDRKGWRLMCWTTVIPRGRSGGRPVMCSPPHPCGLAFPQAAWLLRGLGACSPVPGLPLKVSPRRAPRCRLGSRRREALLWPQH